MRLPKDVGCAVQSVGRMRRLAKSKAMDDTDVDEVSAEDSGTNRLVKQSTRHCLKWVAQLVSEYWPLSKLLATLSDEERLEPTADRPVNPSPIHTLSATRKRRRIVLLGSGHGHSALLTLFTHQILAIHAGLASGLGGQTRPVGLARYHAQQDRTRHREEVPWRDDASRCGRRAERVLCVVRVCFLSLSICLVTNLLPL